MRIAARSDQGKVRDNNEDCLAFDARLGIAVLADGMGGLRAGEVASATAVEAVMQHLVENTDRLGSDDVGETLREALELANRRVYALADSRREFSGMGTTLVVGAMHDGRFVAAHIGDSRAYRFRRWRTGATHVRSQPRAAAGRAGNSVGRGGPARAESQHRHAGGRHRDGRRMRSDGSRCARRRRVSAVQRRLDRHDRRCVDRAVLCGACRSRTDAIVDALIDAALIAGGFDNVSVVVLAP